jgi:hypothetical protein
MPTNGLKGDIVFSTITLEDGRTVRAVMVCESGTAATRIMPEAHPYVRNARNAIMNNKTGRNTASVLAAIPVFLSGKDIEETLSP